MEINRNQYFLAGIVILLLGIQFRVVDSFVLNEPTTKILARQVAETEAKRTMYETATSAGARKVVHPPEWVGWCLMSVGSVLILHSLAMKRPD